VKTDLARLELLAGELVSAGGARATAAVRQRLAALQAVWERAQPFVEHAGARRIATLLGSASEAARSGDLSGIKSKAQSAIEAIEEVQSELE
jgi:hypothetical protein